MNGTAIDEAAEWFATLSDPSCTAEERQTFARWLRRSNVNVEEFLTISTLTRQLETSRAWPDLNIEQLLAEAKRADAPHFLRQALAAAIAVVALGSLLVFGWPDGPSYSTARGELRSVTLEDGSIVQLDAQSTLRERYTDRERLVELRHGTAIFKVTGNPARPFRVTTDFADVVAVGTAFNVSTRQEHAVVTVIEGRVRVEARSQPPLDLGPGQQAVVERDKPLRRAVAVDPAKVTAWTARRLYFEDTPLAAAVEEFARYSELRIRLDDGALAQERITGTFDAADPAALVTFLQRYTNASIEKTEQGWIVGGRK